MGQPREPEEKMSIAIKILDQKIREIQEQAERDVQELLRAREAILKLPKTGAKKTSGGKPGELDYAARDLRGLRLTDAIQAVLNPIGGPLSFATLKTFLEERGVRLGVPSKPQRYAANLKTAVVNNPRRFAYNEKTDTVSLVPDDHDATTPTGPS